MYIAIDGGTELDIRFLTEANLSEFKYSSASGFIQLHLKSLTRTFGLRSIARLPIVAGGGGGVPK